MTFTESIVNYINNQPDTPRVELDMLTRDKASNAICPSERDVVVRAYINGVTRKRFTASLYASRLESEKMDAITALQTLQATLERAKGQVLDAEFYIERLDFTTPAIKDRTGKWVLYGSTATIEYQSKGDLLWT